MIIASWNLRGLNNSLKHRKLVQFLKSNNVDLAGILESKLDVCTLEKIMKNKFKDWDSCNNFEHHQAGRIVVIWLRDRINIQVLSSSSQAIHCRVMCRVTSVVCFVTFVYGLHSIVTRRPLWEFLNALQVSGPWMIVGDFNSIRQPADKHNGADVTEYECSDFNQCCEELGLEELRTVGNKFTWTNGRTWTRIDRILGNHDWFLTFNNSFAFVQDFVSISDHASITIATSINSYRSKKSFKFCNATADLPDFKSFVEQHWISNDQGCKAFMLCKRLKALKGPLKGLFKNHCSNISEQVEIAEKSFSNSMNMLQNSPDDEQLIHETQQHRENLFKLRVMEHTHLAQLAKCKFIISSDRSTSFFHSVISKNKRSRFIPSIVHENGSPTRSLDELGSLFVNHFTQLLGTSQVVNALNIQVCRSGKLVESNVYDNLTRNVSSREVWEVISRFGNDKAPGPDGYNARFFKEAWPIVGNDVVETVQEFFRTGKMLKQMNHALIALVPKKELASKVGDFRPISCCNIVYKIISKILANRIEPVLRSIVGENQAAFISDRLMSENIFLVQELLRKYARKRISPRCMLKVDLHKAFDSVNWEFLRCVLLSFEFPTKFVNLIMECVTTTSFSVMINGNIHGFFEGKRGLRQGDPLSPYLFVLCLEYFSRLLNLAALDKKFKFHPSCQHLKITHLAFADDLMLFSRGDMSSINTIIDCLKEFEMCSGLSFNAHKSAIYLAGVKEPEYSHIMNSIGFAIGEFPFRYLGVPLLSSRLNICHYAPLFNQVRGFISGWKSKSLSYAGRLELVRAVLEGVLSFWMAVFPLPQSVLDKINGMCRHFLWGTNENERSCPLVAWNSVCTPKSEGGLGLHNLKSWNLALLSRVIWDIHSKKDSLWLKWIDHMYMKGQSFWRFNLANNSSSFMRKLTDIREQLLIQTGGESQAISTITAWVKRGKFQASQAYDFFRTAAPKVRWHRVIWDSTIYPRWSFNLWLSAANKLRTLDRAPFLNKGTICPLCHDFDETRNHLLFNCSFSRQIWSSVREWFPLNCQHSTLPRFLYWLTHNRKHSGKVGRARCIALAATTYHIWQARNQRLYEHAPISVSLTIEKIKFVIMRANHVAKLY